jgi:ligand-binding sensor domain-containing protein
MSVTISASVTKSEEDFNYSLDLWRQPEGLPQDTVRAVIQTRDGYIWVGTRGGFARFDGIRFTTFDESNTPELKDNEVSSMVETPDGTLWIGTLGGGVLRYKDKKFKSFTMREGLPSDYIWKMYAAPNGVVWLGTDGGLVRVDGERFRIYSKQNGISHNNVRDITQGPDGSIWFGTKGGGLNRLHGERITNYTLEDGLVDMNIITLTATPDGAIWIGTFSGLSRFSGGKFQTFKKIDGLAGDTVTSLIVGSGGVLWVGTDAGLTRLKNGVFQTYNDSASNINIGYVMSMVMDRERSIWLGTDSGLICMKEGQFFSYTNKDGLPSDYVLSIYEDKQGIIWLGTNRGVTRYFNGVITNYTTKDGLSNNYIMTMCEYPAGTLLIGTGRGLSAYKDGKFKTLTNGGLDSAEIRVIYPDSRGNLWIGSDNKGLIRMDSKGVTYYSPRDGMPFTSIRSITEDRAGNIWIGAKEGGLAKHTDNKFTIYGMKDGLPSSTVMALHVDANDHLWVGTRRGLCRIVNGKIKTFTVKDGLYVDFIYSILEDKNENLWMSCSKGIYRVNKNNLDAFSNGTSGSIRSIAYNTADGLSSAACVAGNQPVAWKTRSGDLWFGTYKGVVVTSEKRTDINTSVPPVLIEKLFVDKSAIDLSERLVLEPGARDITIEYTCLSFLAPERVKFKYKLEGFDKDWIYADSRRSVNYTNLPPGNYRFQVIASNNDGVWNEKGNSFDFYLKPHFYQTYWFFGVCVISMILSGYALNFIRVRKLQIRAAELKRVAEEAVAQLKMLRGLLPICASCKSIRDDNGYWAKIETYIKHNSEADFSHSICPDCMKNLYPDFHDKVCKTEEKSLIN